MTRHHIRNSQNAPKLRSKWEVAPHRSLIFQKILSKRRRQIKNKRMGCQCLCQNMNLNRSLGDVVIVSCSRGLRLRASTQWTACRCPKANLRWRLRPRKVCLRRYHRRRGKYFKLQLLKFRSLETAPQPYRSRGLRKSLGNVPKS